MGVARLIRVMASLVVAVIVAAIVLGLLSVNPSNAVVYHVHDAAQGLVGPFANLFSLHGEKPALALNWGLAAAVYLVAGHLLAKLVARSGPGVLRTAA